MNIAFEISPLITASGTFGDKSGVYRYTYGLISSFSKLLQEKNKEAKIFLFSFNYDLLKQPLNPELYSLFKKKNISYLYNFPKIDKVDNEIINNFFLRQSVSLLNKIFNFKSLYNSIKDRLRFNTYLKFLDKEFKKRKIKIIIHSETCFFPLNNYKHVITIYDLTAIFMPEFHRAETIDLQKRKLRFANEYCQGIICISESTKKDLLKYYPSFKKKKIIIAYPGINLLINQSITKEEEIFDDIVFLTKKNGQRLSEKKYLLYFGTFEPRKNIISLINSFINLHEKKEISSDLKLVLIGGEGWGDIKKMIIDYLNENFPIKSKSNVILFNYLSDKYLFTMIKKAYATVYPSLYEGFGLPVLESMSLGTPVICSNNSSLPEVGGNAVLYFNTDNYQDLKEKIKKLVNSPQLAQKLSQKGILQSKKFSWKKAANKIYNFLKIDLQNE